MIQRFGVLKGHAALLSSVDYGELSFLKDRIKTRYAVHTGYAVLVERAERADLIDLERAKQARERAEQKLVGLSREDSQFERAGLALLRAVTRLNVATKV